MKKLTLLSAICVSVAVIAQTALSPQPIDWRFSFFWDDPNPAGSVTAWTVYASNNVVVRQAATRSLSVDLAALLNGAPAGIYAVFNTATSQLGDVSDQSTNLYVSWPGGNGRIRPGQNTRASK